MTLVLHGPSYNPALPVITPEALATSINNEFTAFWLPLAGGVVSGPLSAPTPAPGDNSTRVATTAFVGAGYLPISGGAMVGPLTYTATGGTVARSAQDMASDTENVLNYGAVPNTAVDSTAAFNAACAAGRDVFVPPGTYRINGQINIPANTTLRGPSSKTAGLYIDQSFSSTANGVLSLSGYELQSPTVRDLSITFAQPPDFPKTAGAASGVGATTITVTDATNILVGNYVGGPNAAIPAMTTITAIAGNVLTLSTAVVAPGVANGDALRFGPGRSNFKTLAAGGTSGVGGTGVRYPPAIYAPSTQTGRPHLQDLYVGGAWDGIFCSGNVVPRITNIEMGALNIGWQSDGGLDTTHVYGWRSWLYGFTGNAIGPFNTHHDGLPQGWRLGRVDGLNASNITFVDANFVTTANADLPGGQPVPWVITDLQMDNTADLIIAGGLLRISSMYRGGSAQPPASINPIQITGGTTTLSNYFIQQNGSVPTIGISGGRLTLVGGFLAMANSAGSALNQSGGTFSLLSSYIVAGSTLTAPVLSQTGGVIIVSGNTMHGGASGVVVSVGADTGDNWIANNDFQQYTLSLPAEPLTGMYSSGFDGAYGYQLVLGRVGQAGRLDFRRASDGGLTAFIGMDAATGNNDLRIRNLSGSANMIFDVAGAFSWRFAGTQYISSANTYSNQFKIGYTGQGGRVDFARGSDGVYAGYIGMVGTTSTTIGLINLSGSGIIQVEVPASGTVALRTAATDRLTVTDTAVTVTQPLTINASGPTIRSGTGAATGTQPSGSLWLRTDGTTANRLYVSAGAGVWETGASAFNGIGRNLIHNPLFNVAQRGTGPFSAGGNTLDRWFITTVSDAVSWIQAPVNDAERAQIGDEAASAAIQNTFTGNAAAGAFNELDQMIEGVRRLAGKTVTLSFYAVASAALKIGINATQSFGTGGSPSGGVNALTTGLQITATTTWARYSVTIVLPSVAGKTLGTAGNDYTQIRMALSSGATYNAFFGNVGVQSGTVKLWGVQLEIGSVATPLEKPDPRYDLSNCTRFFRAVTVNIRALGQTGGTTFAQGVTWPEMRVVPTAVQTTTGTVSPNASSVTLTPQSGSSANLTLISTATAGDCYVLGSTYTLSADL